MSTSIEDLKNQFIKTFATGDSYIHRDDLDELLKIVDTLIRDNQDLKERVTALEAK